MSPGIGVLVAVGLLLANAFFVGAEFALASEADLDEAYRAAADAQKEWEPISFLTIQRCPTNTSL